MEEINKYPRNDNLMQYDYNRHRYFLTENVLLTELGINFNDVPAGMDANPSDRAIRFSKEVSDEVYRYLYKDCMNTGWLRFELATIPELREVIFEMLLAQARYNAKNGFLDDFSGIDIYKGKSFSRKDIEEVHIALSVEEHGETIQPCLGRCLKYAGYFGATPPPYNDKEGNAIY